MAQSSIVTIPPSQFNPSIIPVSLRDFIPPDQWTLICHNLNNVVATSNCYACGGEICFCLCTGFFPIFCCHPCIYAMVHQGLAEEQIRSMNRAYFNGNHVLGFVNGSLTVNLSVLASATAHPAHPIITQPAVLTQTKQSEYQAVSYPSPGVPVAEATPIQTQQRVFYATVPGNAVPGTSMTFTAPTGQIVQVPIPQGAVPGQQLMVYY